MNQIGKVFFLMTCLFTICWGKTSMLTIGDTAPAFSIFDQNGALFNLSDFKDKKFVVLIFYPGDETPVCTQQLCAIRDNYDDFAKHDAVVFGVNPASDKSHQKFIKKNNLPFPLLIDVKSKVASEYQAKGALMNIRTVYVIDKNGKIVFAKRGKPSVAEIINSITGGTNEFDIKK